MTRLTSADLEAVTASLRGIYALEDLAAFPTRMLAELHRLIPCDHIGYNEIDLAEHRAAVVFDTPEAVPPALLQGFARLADQHPLIAYYASTGDSRAYKFSDFLTQRELHRLDIYNAFFRHMPAAKAQTVTPSLVELVDKVGTLSLTYREAEVLGCLLKGRSDVEIAEELMVTPWTVHKHLQHIYRKLGVQSRTQAIARAFEALQRNRVTDLTGM